MIVRLEIIGASRGITPEGNRKNSLWNSYLKADFVTEPSLYEGFGNTFLEAIWFRKPIFVNRYSIFEQDIEPVDFDVVTMDSYITDDTLDAIRAILDTPEAVCMMTMKNFELGKQFFSFSLLEQADQTGINEVWTGLNLTILRNTLTISSEGSISPFTQSTRN